MGATFAPMGALLPELFPSGLRYTGAGTAYNLGGILGASFAPYIAQRLVTEGGLAWGWRLCSLAAAISLLAVYLMRKLEIIGGYRASSKVTEPSLPNWLICFMIDGTRWGSPSKQSFKL